MYHQRCRIQKKEYRTVQIKIPLARHSLVRSSVLSTVKEEKFEMVVNGYLRDGRRTRN